METHRLALIPGYQIEQFRIEGMLGKGGFGITYVALDLQLGKKVAIKELLPDSIATRVDGLTIVPQSSALAENWEWARERFLNEARILAGFSHPAIVGVHRLIEANGTVYMVMDFVDGESYEARLRRIGREPDEEALMEVIGPLLGGLEEVHRTGLIHRDIKPENILISQRGKPILIDFGSARESVGKTATMTSIVTHGYSPIEQYQTKGRMGPWTDIYALGAVMCRAITGEKPPVAADRLVDDEFQALHFQPLNGYTSTFLEAVDHALMLRPETRPQNIRDWQFQLRRGDAPSRNRNQFEPAHEAIPPPIIEQPPELPSEFRSREAHPPKSSAGKAISIFAAIIIVILLIFIALPSGKTPSSQGISAAAESQSDALESRQAKIRTEAEEAKRASEEAARERAAQKQQDELRMEEKKRKESARLLAAAAEESRKNPADATQESPYINSLGMKFVPLPGTSVLISKWETRVKDYKAFWSTEPGSYPSTVTKFIQNGEDPVVNVSWEDAQAFCKWLSLKDGKTYRLPTDEEWSLAVGLQNEPGSSPKEKDGAIPGFPWGPTWPPPYAEGNYAPSLNVDSYEHTSPVGSFHPNGIGIMDLSGNVWEWCADYLGPDSKFRVVRGGGWSSREEAMLKSSFRTGIQPQARRDFVGFRCVVETTPAD